jgi:group I intron endonuclease
LPSISGKRVRWILSRDIYIAINKINNKVYVGQTTHTVEQRKQKHFQEVRSEIKGKRKSVYFHNAIKKYGEDAFEFYEIDSASSIEELYKQEVYWIAQFNATDKRFGYNLDTGGNSNYKRSDSTIKKLRESTLKLHAENELYRQSSLQGLAKGLESWKKICESKQTVLVCPICKKEFSLPPHLANVRTYCSQECSKIGNHQISIENAKLATQKNIENKIAQNIAIASELKKWASTHQDIILNCPFNKISSTLEDMRIHIENTFGVKDWRTIGDSIGCTYKKELLQYLKNYLNENICCSSPN